MPSADELAARALHLLQQEGDPREARALLVEAARQAPERADLLHALGVVHLQLGEPVVARAALQEALPRATEPLLVEGCLLSLAAAAEDLDEPAAARAAYARLLTQTPAPPRALVGLAHLHFACGELDSALGLLDRYLAESRDEPAYEEAARAVNDAVRRFRAREIPPMRLVEAHRGAYVQFFDEQAAAHPDWIPEAARMRRLPGGRLAPVVPEGARPYAAVRVDLVNPQTFDVGQVGDQPMVVALADFEALARAPIVFPTEDARLRVSSQAPWDQLPVHVLVADAGALEAVDAAIGGWYARGFDGAWGGRDGGRLHYISDPEPSRGGRAVTYHVDLGRAAFGAVADLAERLLAIGGVERVLIGRGHVAG